MSEVLATLAQSRLLPVVVLHHEADVDVLAVALTAGGIRSIEITLRTPSGVEAIRRAARVPGLLVGAGTVRTHAQLQAAVDAGARFVVSPGLDEQLVHAALDLGITPIPGVATPTEVHRAANLGLTHVKLFPARELGGPSMVAALAGPFPDMRFLPSGGVSASNAREYLDLDSVFAVSGSWFVPQASIAERDEAALRQLAREAADLVGLP